MKTILLWDPRFPDRRPVRLTLEDTVASAAVRAGVAAAANPAEAGALSAGGALDPGMITEVVLQHGTRNLTRRAFLPYSVVMVGAAAGVLASIGTPITGGVIPTPSELPKYPNFPKKVKQLRGLSDLASYNTDATRFAVVQSPDSIDGRNVLSLKVNGTYNRTTCRASLGTAWDMRNGVIGLWVKRISTEMTVTVNLWSAGTPAAPSANYSTVAYNTGTFAEAFDGGVFCQAGWHSSRVVTTGTGADLSAVTHIEIQVGDGQGAAFEAQIGDFTFTLNPRTKAAVIFKCADAFADPYTVLRPMAQAKGLVVPYFMTPGAVESGNGYDRGYPARMTTDQVNALRAEGTQSGTQAWTTEAAQPDYPSYVTEYNGMREYNKRKGWYEDAADDSFHSGVNAGSPNSRAAKIATGARTIQRFKNNAVKNTLPPMLQPETFPFRDRMSHVCMNVAVLGTGTQTAIAQTMSHIDGAIKVNGVAEFAIHGNVLNNQNTVDLFNAILDRKNSANDFEFHTPLSLLTPWLALYGPSDPYEFPYSMKS